MEEWTLHPDDPYRFTLAVDARVAIVDYLDDQIWELTVGKSEPPSISLQTTFGLRARSFRMFPRFGEMDEIISDPRSFTSPIKVLRYCPSFIRLAFDPLPDIHAEMEYLVTCSQAILGKINLTNSRSNSRTIYFEIAGNMVPGTQGTRLSANQFDSTTILTGKSDGIEPVLIMVGGAQASNSPFPALTAKVELSPNGHQTLTWVLAALPDLSSSLNLARKQAEKNIDAEITRLEILDEGRLEIHTGNPEWDLAFDLAQTIALSLFIGPTHSLPNASFVFSRHPDLGYSIRGDGSDYNYLWNGQSPLETYILANLVLPFAPELIKGLILNFLAIQGSDGMVDWKPGLADQRSQIPAPPLLASLAWLYYEHTEDLNFIANTFQNLLDFLKAWGNPLFDRDNDGIPEWSHVYQIGMDDHPLFSHWLPWSQGRDITTVESPDLCAYLYHECAVLNKMARLLHRNDVQNFLGSMARRLRKQCNAFWDDSEASYMYLDRDGHNNTPFEMLASIKGSGTTLLHKEINVPSRLLIHILPSEATTRRVMVFLHGVGQGGTHRIERIATEDFKWIPGRGIATSERLYSVIEHVELQGLSENDECKIFIAGIKQKDLSLFLPLWAGIPSKKYAQEMIENTILNPSSFLCNYGLKTYLPETNKNIEDPPPTFLIPWNLMIGEGLLNYQYRQQAAELLMRIMGAVTSNQRTEGGFRQAYNVENGQGSGEKNSLHGLAPVGFFMNILGVRFITPKRILLDGFNPFPWPVTVKYRGTTVLRHKEKTSVIFPDGQTISTERTSPTILALR